jgi:hypothetical protein
LKTVGNNEASSTIQNKLQQVRELEEEVSPLNCFLFETSSSLSN